MGAIRAKWVRSECTKSSGEYLANRTKSWRAIGIEIVRLSSGLREFERDRERLFRVAMVATRKNLRREIWNGPESADKKSTTIGVEMDPIRAKSERNRTKSERNSENGEKSLKIFCKSWERIRSNRIRSVRNGRGIGVRNGCDPCEIREKF